MKIDDAVIAEFGGKLDLSLRSQALAGRLSMPHARVVMVMKNLIEAGRLVGATVTRDGVQEIEARLALASNAGVMPPAPKQPPPAPSVVRKSDEKRQAILDFLGASAQRVTPAKIAEAIGHTVPATSYLLTTMATRGQVQRHGYGRWTTWSLPTAASEGATAPAAMPAPARRSERTPRAEPEETVSTLRVAAVKNDQLVVGLFSDGHLELTVGDELMRLRPENTRILFEFLDRFSGLAEVPA